MKILELTTKEQLEALKKNDNLIVQWKYHPVTGHTYNEITMAKIWGINHNHEVIVQKKSCLYFSIEMFLKGESSAVQVYQVVND